jgi:hypothetical protein
MQQGAKQEQWKQQRQQAKRLPPKLTFTYPVFFLVVSFRDTSSAFYPPTKMSRAT